MPLAVPTQITESYRFLQWGTMAAIPCGLDWMPDESTPGNRIDLLTDSFSPIKSWRKESGEWVEGPAWTPDESFKLWTPGMPR